MVIRLDLNESQFYSLAEELARLLGWDLRVLKAYTFLLSRSGETMKEELASDVGASDCEVGALLGSLDTDGLIIRGQLGFYPVHPRLGISNVYRLSIARDPAVVARRPRVDSLMAMLASYRDRVEDTRFAGPSKAEKAGN
jgi:hypothetical protein